MTQSTDTKQQAGFTVVELVVVILVSSILAISIFQLIGGINNFAINSSRRITASNLAYNNMRKFANGLSPRWFICNGDGDPDDDAGQPWSDGKTYPNATGQVLFTQTTNTIVNNMPPPIVETVIAVAPYGCGLTGAGQPIRVQSQVDYGPTATKRTVTHATYVSY